MVTSSRPTVSLPHSLLSVYLITPFVIAAILNSYGVEGRSISNDQMEYVDDLGGVTHFTLNDDSGTTTRAPIVAMATSTLPSSKNLTQQKPKYDPYPSYMKGMTGPLGENDVEYSLDYYNEKNLIKEYDFDPMHLVKKLIDSAISQNTTPAEFLEEIGDLITLQNRSKTEQSEGSKGRDAVPTLPPGFMNLNENLIKSVYDGWKNELKRLEKKYNITTECCGSDSITSTRLSLMFPHYLNFGQKPFAVPLEISLHSSSSNNNYNYNYGSSSSYNVPSFFKRHEFGGLIPRWELDDLTRQTIIGVHLYALYRDLQNDMVPFRTKCIMLRRRMEKSVLSEARRLRFLRNNDIINREGKLLKTSLKNAYDNIPSDFKMKIDWALLKLNSTGSASSFAYIPQ